MAYHEPCNQISEKNSFDHPSPPNVSPHMANPSIENQLAECPRFKICQDRLAKLVETKEIESLQQSGGIHELVAALDTNLATGISGDGRDLSRRHQAFGSNLHLDEQPSTMMKEFYGLAMEAFKDSTVILLLCCATLSLVIEIKRNGAEEGFLDGAVTFLAILLVINFGVICRYCKARRKIKKLSRTKNVVGVMRLGKMQQVPTSEIVVGDILCLKSGDQVPADGLLVHGGSFKLEDGSVHEHEGFNYSKYPSLFAGGKVVEDSCRMLVTAVGHNTERSKLMRSISNHQSEDSRLQMAIDKTNSRLEKIWLSLSLLILLVQLLRCFVWKPVSENNHNPDPKGIKNTAEEIMTGVTKLMKKQGVRIHRLVAVLCILVFAIRDGLPLGTFIYLAYASKKMVSYRAMVGKLPACATIGLVTTICTGKTIDLALQHEKMADLWIGLDNINEVSKEVAHEVLSKLSEGIFTNLQYNGDTAISLTSEDDCLLYWAQKVLGTNMEEVNRNCTILHSEPFDLSRNRRGILLGRNEEVGKAMHVHWKGDPQVVLSMCSHYYDVAGTMQTLNQEKIVLLSQIIDKILSEGLHCFAFAYKQIAVQENEESPKLGEEEEQEETLKTTEHGLTFLGLVSMKNPYAAEVREAVKACRESGVKSKLVVGDDLNTAKIMAVHAGILRPEEDMEGAVIKASEFQSSSEEDRMKMIDNIRVMAETSPSDKLLMVKCLRQKGEVVAVTGTCNRDTPSLKEADVGLFLGRTKEGPSACETSPDSAVIRDSYTRWLVSDAEAAKEEADILVLGMDLGTIYRIIKLGKGVCNNLEKFIQLQLTLNIVAFAVNSILLVSKSETPLTPFQLLWVNLIMDILGALALAASTAEPPPSQTQQEKPPPVYGAGPIITKTMRRSIAVQSLYQVILLLILDLMGKAILHVDETTLKAMIFNCYLLCQVSELFSTRETQIKNIFVGIVKHESCWFLVILGTIFILQVVVTEAAAVVVHTGRLDLKQWCICIAISAVAMPIDWVARWVHSVYFTSDLICK
ncbi:unnamed protein product [Ilex paraguariensis]|uniref:Calcium-transporting ATPase n=1 Tax=Ilex paraguariensis TaxID=185542 RepID=A0ABC8UIY9_9AQUA